MGDQNFSYLNRDLSWLSFNHRVLMEASDPAVPVYNRIQFLSIFSSNLDEFFRVRMPSIYAFSNIKTKKNNLRDEYPEELLGVVRATVKKHLDDFGHVLRDQVLPELKRNHIHLYYGEEILPEHSEEIREYFLSKVLSFLQPVILTEENKARIFLENNRLYFIVELESPAEQETPLFGLLNIPSEHLPRFTELAVIGQDHYILFLDDALRENLPEIFPGFRVKGAYSVKLTRDAELHLEDEFSGDLVEKIEKQLEKRDIGHSTRFLFESSMPTDCRGFIKNYFSVSDEEMVEGGRYHNLKDLGSLPNPNGKAAAYGLKPAINHPGFNNRRSVFKTIQDKDRLLHQPYHSYNYVLRFFNEAAIDPAVKEIYASLYRVATNSQIVNALISAARNGKKVTVFVELKARFDEANNLRWSKKMKAAGIRIIYSIPGLKVHAKTALIIREQDDNKEYYSFLATGNFNESTSRFYTDHVFFTTHNEIGIELEQLFAYLLSRVQPEQYGKLKFRHLLVSKFNMVKRFRKLIRREIRNARNGLPAGIIIKLNNLQEREMIDALYEASLAGVRVQLIIRSICCLAPGIIGQSENVSVHRIVDRYLEHSRVFMFHNNGEPEFYMGSADWMNRNLHSRVEVIFPVYNKQLCEELYQILQLHLSDNTKAVYFRNDLTNDRILPREDQPLVNSQEAIYEYIKSLKE